MKTPVTLLVAAVALLLANLAFAGATFRDVETAVKTNHDYQQGETLIREVVAGDPDNARDHYVYSQILHHNGKQADAAREMAEAKRLDPAYSFDKNPARVAAYAASLNADGGQAAAPRYEPGTEVIAPQPIPIERKSGHGLLWAVLILGVLGVAGYFFNRRVQEQARLENEARMKATRQEQMKQTDALLESVKPLKLDIRMANPPDTALLAELDEVEKALVDLIDRLAKLPVPQHEIDRQAEALAHLHRKFEGKPEPEPEFQPVVQSNQPVYDNTGYGNPGGFAQPVYQQPQTVYVENNNGGMGGGLLTGLVLGSMMGGGRDREVIREVREVPSGGNAGNDQSDIDFGNDGNDVADSGGVDFGGSDDS